MGTNVMEFPLGHQLTEGEQIMGIPHHLLGKARSDVADQWQAYTSVTDEDNNKFGLFSVHHDKDFHRFGVGVQLYFRLLWHLGALFLLMVVVTIPQIVFCWSGNMLAQISNSFFLWTMLANVGTMPEYSDNNDEEKLIALLDRPVVFWTGHTFSARAAVTISSALDVLMICLISCWAFYFWLVIIPKAVNVFDEQTWRMSDHALLCFNIPCIEGGCTNEEYESMLSDHFTTVAHGNQGREAEYRRSGCTSPSKALQVVSGIYVVQDFKGQFKNITKCGELSREIVLINAREHNGMDSGKAAKHRKKICMKMVKLVQLVLDEWVPPEQRRQCMAFITFRYAFDKDYIEDLYKPYATRYSVLNMEHKAPDLMLMDKAIRVIQAPEPEGIMWENLDMDSGRKQLITSSVWIIAFVLIGGYMAIVWGFTLIEIESIPPPTTTTAVSVLAHSPNAGWHFCDVEVYSDFSCTSQIIPTDFVPYWDQDARYITSDANLAWDTSNLCVSDNRWVTKGERGIIKDSQGVVAVLPQRSEVRCVKLKQSYTADWATTELSINFCAEAGIAYDNEDPDSVSNPLPDVTNYAWF
eukprot:GHVH01016722.1.p1 GENE.GHVH01016722.1~~GHVH01016722.1.p1  ORF type:complete len:581 (+),score=58.92 GHVH01016722.1:128-1870(+)